MDTRKLLQRAAINLQEIQKDKVIHLKIHQTRKETMEVFIEVSDNIPPLLFWLNADNFASDVD